MHSTTLGILGGGQLGYLLHKAANDFPINVKVLDPNPHCTCSTFSGLTVGDFTDYQTVLDFASDCDYLVAEIELVNAQALQELKENGKKVIPDPQTLEIIQDKAKQRQFFSEKGLPGPDFQILSADQLKTFTSDKPLVQKLRTGGYDGQGVKVLQANEMPANFLPGDSLLEDRVEIEKELSVVACRTLDGDFQAYHPTEMAFTEANLLDYMLAPAQISDSQAQSAIDITQKIGETLNYEGVYAVELFLTKSGKILLNEVSPRVHNSGHHTVFAYNVSQYQQLLRIALGLPLMPIKQFSHSLLVNLIADTNAHGQVVYQGLEKILGHPQIHFTFYNKNTVRPHRKMGHAVILEDDFQKGVEIANLIKNTLTITGDE